MKWRLYYDDGRVFSEGDGHLTDAPAFGVLVAAKDGGPTVGRLLRTGDYYWYEHGTWEAGDYIGLVDFLQRSGLVKFGRMVPREQFEACVRRAIADDGLPPKTATDDLERDIL